MEAAKSREIKAGEDLVDTKIVAMADAKEKNAQSKEDLVDTNAAKKADTKFLMDLKLKCQNADHEYEQRTKVRNEELMAVGETLGILTDDDARDLMSKSTFIQTSMNSKHQSALREQAATILKTAAKRLGSPQLSA